MRNLIAAASALGLAVAPVAANAGTRANDVVPAAAVIDRDFAPVAGSSEFGGEGSGAAIIIAVLAAAAVIAGILAAIDDDEGDDLSPG